MAAIKMTFLVLYVQRPLTLSFVLHVTLGSSNNQGFFFFSSNFSCSSEILIYANNALFVSFVMLLANI